MTTTSGTITMTMRELDWLDGGINATVRQIAEQHTSPPS